MISKNRAKFIVSLQKKKVRDDERLFIIEGDKLVREFMASGIRMHSLIAKPEFISSISGEHLSNVAEVDDVSYEELKSVSTLKTPHNALAIIPMPDKVLNVNEVFNDICVALDFVQDPGNLGTIIRAAAWFGIKNIICSPDCVDVYNPKVIQASMGALLHVNVFYSDLKIFLAAFEKENISVFGTLLEGESIYSHRLANKGIILLGNESKGISADLLPYITEKIMIPKFSMGKHGIDSLNVGMAASVVFSEFARRSGGLS
ncbi:MAG: RNA methyltransferase [Bacteroidales bacterium]|nr:RNA methyltransferase [Bacteroidales bacterium]